MEQVYRGKLTVHPDYLDTAGTLCLSPGEEWDDMTDSPLAETIQDAIAKSGNHLTVGYSLTDFPLSDEMARIMTVIEGVGYARYDVYYDEWENTEGLQTAFDGYVQDITITRQDKSRFDLLRALENHVGKYLYLVIDYQQQKKEKVA